MRKSRTAEIISGSICVAGAIFIVWLAGVKDPYKK
jgi:hypothetical protein